MQGSVRQASFSPRQELLSGDLLRVGYEDAHGHRIERVGRSVPKGGRYSLPAAAGGIPKGTPVFLIDRREKALEELIQQLDAERAPSPPAADSHPSAFKARLPRNAHTAFRPIDLKVHRQPPRPPFPHRMGLWLSPEALASVPTPSHRSVWWWLPPALFPDDEASYRALVHSARSQGGRTFVLNDPWQVALFAPDTAEVMLWAGPFCNLTNPLALETAAGLGFNGAIVSPELASADFLQLPGRSPLPLGAVVAGNWPLCIARFIAADLQEQTPLRSPKGEEAWAVRYGSLYWVFPNWELDLKERTELLRRAGYRLFVHLVEPRPPVVQRKDRPGLWNWEGELL
jgi:putative protease